LLGRGVGDGAPLDAGREAGTAASTQTRCDHLLDDRLGADFKRLLQPEIAFMAFVVLETTGIDDAAAVEGKASLPLEPGDLLDKPVPEAMLGAVEHAGIEQTVDIARLNRSIADAALRTFHLDQRLEPIKPARARAYDLDIEPAPLEGLAKGGRDLLGAHTQRTRIARDEDTRPHACASLSR